MPGQVSTKRCPSPLHIGERVIFTSEFGFSAKDGLQSWCKACKKAAYTVRADEICLKLAERYREDKDYRELKKDVSRRWRRDNPERFLQQVADWNRRNPERVALNRRNARRRRREYHRVQLILYRARKKAAGGNATVAKIRARWDYFNGRCWMCGKSADSMDHVKPVLAGGGSWASNLRPACRPCNSRKGGRWPYNPLQD